MFGQKDDDSDQTSGGSSGGNGPAPIASAATDPSASVVDNSAWQHPGPPPSQSDEMSPDVISPAGGFPNAPSSKITDDPSLPDEPAGDDAAAVTDAADNLAASTEPSDNDLLDIKQQALHELAPLIDQLDMSPEDKFHTIMMMIQASDDQNLVEKAYEAAHSIEDEHARAQALLDIVNEINYFTQPNGQSGQSQPEA